MRMAESSKLSLVFLIQIQVLSLFQSSTVRYRSCLNQLHEIVFKMAIFITSLTPYPILVRYGNILYIGLISDGEMIKKIDILCLLSGPYRLIRNPALRNLCYYFEFLVRMDRIYLSCSIRIRIQEGKKLEISCFEVLDFLF